MSKDSQKEESIVSKESESMTSSIKSSSKQSSVKMTKMSDDSLEEGGDIMLETVMSEVKVKGEQKEAKEFKEEKESEKISELLSLMSESQQTEFKKELVEKEQEMYMKSLIQKKYNVKAEEKEEEEEEEEEEDEEKKQRLESIQMEKDERGRVQRELEEKLAEEKKRLEELQEQKEKEEQKRKEEEEKVIKAEALLAEGLKTVEKLPVQLEQGQTPSDQLHQVKALLARSLRLSQVVEPLKNKVEQYSNNNTYEIINLEDCLESETVKYNFKNCEPDLMHQIEQHPFMDFCHDNLPVETKMMVFGVAVEEQMKHQSTILKKPLTDFKKKKEAVRVFKNMLKFTGEKVNKYNKKDTTFLTKILIFGYKGSGELRDETYLQVMKQLHSTPSLELRIKYFELLGVLGATFAPSKNSLCYAVLHQLVDWGNDQKLHKDVRRWARFCFVKIKQSFVMGMRSELPTTEEIKTIKQMKQTFFTLYFMNGNCIQLQIETHCTVKQLLLKVIDYLDLDPLRLPHYQLLEVKETNNSIMERFLESDVLISDVLAIQHAIMRKNKNQEMLDLKIYLKVRLHYEYGLNDRNSCTLDYMQAVYDVVHCRTRVTYEQSLLLASIQMVYVYAQLFDPEHFREEYRTFLPEHIVDKHELNVWLSLLMPLYSEIMHYSKLECMLAYMQLLKQHDLFRAQTFLVKAALNIQEKPCAIQSQLTDGEQVLIAITPTEMLFCHSTTFHVLHYTSDKEPQEGEEVEEKECRFPLNSILSWGVSSYYFTVVVDINTVYNKVYFETKQGRALDYILSGYTQQLIGNKINPDALTLQKGIHISEFTTSITKEEMEKQYQNFKQTKKKNLFENVHFTSYTKQYYVDQDQNNSLRFDQIPQEENDQDNQELDNIQIYN